MAGPPSPKAGSAPTLALSHGASVGGHDILGGARINLAAGW